MTGPRAAALALLLLLGTPSAADAQVFIASRPGPEFAIGPLFIRANVTPELEGVRVDVVWSLSVPPDRSGAAVEQDLYLLWPAGLAADPALGPGDPELERYVEARGFTAIESGRVELTARYLYGAGRDRVTEAVPGGAPFVSFVRDDSGPLGLSAPGSWIRIPWSPRMVNRTWLMRLRMQNRTLIKEKPATWVERALWGPRHRITLSFNEVRSRALFPFYLEHRDRVVRLAEEPAELTLNFRDSPRLKIDELFPQSARRRLSETLQTTETVSMYLDRSEGLTPQVLSVQFGYFSGWQSWAPILIPGIAFLLGNLAGPLIRVGAVHIGRRLRGRLDVGRRRIEHPARQTGVVLPRDVVARIVPGTTTYQEVLRLCGPDVEEHESLAAPTRRTLVYRGQRVAPERRRIFSWLATVSGWVVEHHEVEITVDGDRVTDVQARVRRSRLSSPAATPPSGTLS